MFKTYYHLAKPGIIWGNCIAATGGFMLASNGNPDVLLYFWTILGVALIIGSGCVFNNVIDSDIDSLMSRTQKRALVTGTVSKKTALIYGNVLGFIGFGILFSLTNLFTFLTGLFGFYIYVVMYSLFYKRSSIHGTLVGSASGACPPVMGYLSVTGEPNITALLLFLGFCAWQMPHSYAIAIFRQQDYQASQIPLLPIVRGLKSAQRQMLFYTLVYLATIIGLFVCGSVGYFTLIIMTVITLYWAYQTVHSFSPELADFDPQQWGKKLFLISILVVTVYSIVISVDFWFRSFVAFIISYL